MTRLTIGMATYDDYDGVFFSVQAIRMYHPEITDQIELLVIDEYFQLVDNTFQILKG